MRRLRVLLALCLLSVGSSTLAESLRWSCWIYKGNCEYIEGVVSEKFATKYPHPRYEIVIVKWGQYVRERTGGRACHGWCVTEA